MSSKTIPPIELLDADHSAVLDRLAHYRELAMDKAPPARRGALAEQICTDLAIHARLEEEIFYPEVRRLLGDDDLVDEAESDHAAAKDLVAQILAMRPEDGLYDAKVCVLGDYVARHIRHEREQIFARLRRSGLDLAPLARRLAERRRELMAVPEALREEAQVAWA
jgi:hypothetical protein